MSETLFRALKLQKSPDLSFTFFLPLFSPEPPSLSIHPSPLPLAVAGQTLAVQCDASGFAPLSLELSWEFKGSDGEARPLGPGSVTGHRQAWDGTYSQSSRLELDPAALGPGGEVTCVAGHLGGPRRASVTLNVVGKAEELERSGGPEGLFCSSADMVELERAPM